MRRSIIQVAIAGVHPAAVQARYVVTVLCDDGSVWVMDDSHSEWTRLPKIPQFSDDVAADKKG